MFYTDDCEECKRIAHILNRDKRRLKNKVKVGIVNGKDQKGLVDKLSITKYPTIKYFISQEGQRTLADTKDYEINELHTIMPLADDMIRNHANELEYLNDNR